MCDRNFANFGFALDSTNRTESEMAPGSLVTRKLFGHPEGRLRRGDFPGENLVVTDGFN